MSKKHLIYFPLQCFHIVRPLAMIMLFWTRPGDRPNCSKLIQWQLESWGLGSHIVYKGVYWKSTAGRERGEGRGCLCNDLVGVGFWWTWGGQGQSSQWAQFACWAGRACSGQGKGCCTMTPRWHWPFTNIIKAMVERVQPAGLVVSSHYPGWVGCIFVQGYPDCN